MNPLKEVLKVFNKNKISFNDLLQWHLLNGIVMSDDKSFVFAIPCDSEDLEIPVTIEKANCIFISMFSGDLVHSMKLLEDNFDFVAFKREFKNSNHIRMYSYHQFQSKLKKLYGK